MNGSLHISTCQCIVAIGDCTHADKCPPQISIVDSPIDATSKTNFVRPRLFVVFTHLSEQDSWYSIDCSLLC